MNYLYDFKILIISLLCFVLSQHAEAQLKPTKTKAVIEFIFKDPRDNQAVADVKFRIVSQNGTKSFNLETDKNGMASVLVGVDNSYSIHLSNWENFATVEIPKGAYQKHEVPVPYYKMPDNGAVLELSIPVQIQLVNQSGRVSMLQEQLKITSASTHQSTLIQTNKNGLAELKLPIGTSYMLSLEDAPNYYKFDIPNKPYAAWTEAVYFERKEGMDLYPSVYKALINFIFKDLKGKPVEGESFWVVAQKNGIKYSGKTNALGIAQILVPINDTYVLNTANNLAFGVQELLLEEDSDLIMETIEYESISTKEWNERRREQALLSAQRDSLIQDRTKKIAHQVDSMEKAAMDKKSIDRLIKRNFPIPIMRTFRIRKAVVAKAAYFQEQIRINALAFEDHSKPILATLQRFKTSWQGKLIVTDITHSMQPYLEEVLIWHILNLQAGDYCKYIFFNDGDNKMASAKKIGATGGIYPCKGAYEELDTIIETMHRAMENGLGGGEPPENDIEALLSGIENQTDIEEVVLIADAYSRVRDMALLSKVTIPVRIILCGAEEQNSFYRGVTNAVNEEYLTIAHRTNGSVHTLKEDIIGLSQLKEGEIVEVSGKKYILRNKQFIKLQ